MNKIQSSNHTFPMRYQPLIHYAMRLRVALKLPRFRKILSFGCSTGDELHSLSMLAPQTRIYGTDADPAAIARATVVGEALGIEVFPSSWRRIRQRGKYDLILANAVLCRHPETVNLDKIAPLYSFQAFYDDISELVDALAPGGILIAADTNFPVAYATEASELVPVSIGIGRPHQNIYLPFAGTVERFARTGDKFGHRVNTPFEDGFEILQDPELPMPEALLDAVFIKKPLKVEADRFEIRFTPNEQAAALEPVSKAVTEMWSPSRLGTPFVGQRVIRDLRKISQSASLLLEQRQIVDLASESVVADQVSATMASTLLASAYRHDFVADRYVSTSFLYHKDGEELPVENG